MGILMGLKRTGTRKNINVISFEQTSSTISVDGELSTIITEDDVTKHVSVPVICCSEHSKAVFCASVEVKSLSLPRYSLSIFP